MRSVQPDGTSATADTGLPTALVEALRDRMLGWRDRLLGSRRFQSLAASLPLTRTITQRQTRAMFDLCAGFVYSQTLLACVRLEIFQALAGGPLTLGQLALHAQLEPERMQILLNAAVSLRLLEARGQGRYGLGMLGGALLANPGVVAMIEHHAMFYRDLEDPIDLLRKPRGETELGRYWAYATSRDPAALEPDKVEAYTGLMAASQSFIAGEVLNTFSLHGAVRLLDVGGGAGVFVEHALHSAPKLEAMLFDLPPVAAIAQQRLHGIGLGARVNCHGGSFFTDELPKGADILSLVRVIHDHDDDAALDILKRARRALGADGTLLLAEPMAGIGQAPAMGDAYFGFFLLAMGSGRPRRFAEIASLMTRAGFTKVRLHRTRNPILVQVVSAKPDTF